MHQFGTEHLQTLLQLFNLVLNIFLDGGILMKTITDVNVHERLGIAYRNAPPSAFLSRLYTRLKKDKAEMRTKFFLNNMQPDQGWLAVKKIRVSRPSHVISQRSLRPSSAIYAVKALVTTVVRRS